MTNRSIVGSVIKVNGSGSITVITKHYNHNSAILKIEKLLKYFGVTKENTQLRSYLISAIQS